MTTYAGRPVFPPYFIDPTGDPQESVSITVYNRGTLVKPSLYTSRTKAAPLANPFTADSLGNAEFYVDPGEYDAAVNGATLPFSAVLDPAEPFDAEIADLSITTAKLAAGAVTAAKVAVDVATQAELDAAISGLSVIYAPAAGIAQSAVTDLVDDLATKLVQGELVHVARHFGATTAQRTAFGNGVSKPLSGYYASLPAAQVDYPLAAATTDQLDGAIIQKAIATAAGELIHVDPGTYVINQQLSYITAASTFLTPGLKLEGAGSQLTIFDNRVANNALFKVDTTTTNKNQQGVRLVGFKIKKFTATAASSGISLRRCYMPTVEDVEITDLSADGIQLPVSEGDGDSTNMLALRNVRIDTCAGWGINNDSPIHNETSFMTADGLFVTSCGTDMGDYADTVDPTSGGIKWKGQIARFSGAATTCHNVGLFVPGGTGQASDLHMENFDFEHNRRKQMVIRGLAGGLFNGTQFYNQLDVSFPSKRGVVLDGTTYGIQNVRFRSTKVRASAGNTPYQMFTIVGANVQEPTFEDTKWDLFDAPGQVRYAGLALARNARVIDEGKKFVEHDAYFLRGLTNRTVTASAASPTLTLAAGGHGLSAGMVVRFATTGTLPAPLAINTDYVVTATAATTIEVALLVGGHMALGGGTPITMTDTGTGTHSMDNTYSPDVDRYRNHMVYLCSSGAFTIANPTFAGSGLFTNGRTFKLVIRNVSGLSPTVTLGAQLAQTGFVAPVNGATKSTEFIYNSLDGTPWRQFGGWTAGPIAALGAAATDPASTQTLANNIRTALINAGLATA